MSCQAELRAYGDELGNERQNQQRSLLQLLTVYVTDFQEAIHGSSKSLNPERSKRLIGGARISHIFTSDYGMEVKSMEATDDLDIDQVRTAIRNSSVLFSFDCCKSLTNQTMKFRGRDRLFSFRKDRLKF